MQSAHCRQPVGPEAVANNRGMWLFLPTGRTSAPWSGPWAMAEPYCHFQGKLSVSTHVELLRCQEYIFTELALLSMKQTGSSQVWELCSSELTMIKADLGAPSPSCFSTPVHPVCACCPGCIPAKPPCSTHTLFPFHPFFCL